MDIHFVILSDKAEESLLKTPAHITQKLLAWATAVKEQGLRQVRKIPGYHDEPLEGKWRGFRSIRLNRSYRAIYKIAENDTIEFVDVIEVNKHEY
jgi:proteic killer suppression protein